MSVIGELLMSLFLGYLSLTNGAADIILSVTNPDDSPTQTTVSALDLEKIPSRSETGIPRILLDSIEYQSAALSDSDQDVSSSITENPLEAIVNIFCTLRSDDYIRTTTGTGFFVDPDGVIMTNAHVAQFLILENTNDIGEVECIVRNGNPASPKYQAELLYLPPAWIQDNADVINAKAPMGTGERDYALLYVNESIDNSPLPARFPALNINPDSLPLSIRESQVLAAGYPAKPLLENGPQAELIPQEATTTISELYTFDSNLADVLSIRGSVVGAEGSSGGPVLNDDNEVIAMIVTRGNDASDGTGSLRAITMAHIDRTMIQETNFTLKQNLNGNLSYRSNIFAETITPFLLTILQGAN